jgi:hypothetical protein
MSMNCINLNLSTLFWSFVCVQSSAEPVGLVCHRGEQRQHDAIPGGAIVNVGAEPEESAVYSTVVRLASWMPAMRLVRRCDSSRCQIIFDVRIVR